jgi:hypothetical protein
MVEIEFSLFVLDINQAQGGTGGELAVLNPLGVHY